eukprot:757439-Hanusia_phi.AAC.6
MSTEISGRIEAIDAQMSSAEQEIANNKAKKEEWMVKLVELSDTADKAKVSRFSKPYLFSPSLCRFVALSLPISRIFFLPLRFSAFCLDLFHIFLRHPANPDTGRRKFCRPHSSTAWRTIRGQQPIDFALLHQDDLYVQVKKSTYDDQSSSLDSDLQQVRRCSSQELLSDFSCSTTKRSPRWAALFSSWTTSLPPAPREVCQDCT